MDGLTSPSPERNDGARVVVGDVLEFSAPIAADARRVSFQVVVERELNGERSVIARHPSRSPIAFDIPSARSTSTNWSA